MDWRLIASRSVVPAFVGACLLLGGSAQGAGFNLLLQIASIAILVVLWGNKMPAGAKRRTGILSAILVGAIGLALLQLVPLPPAIWTTLPFREVVSEGFQVFQAPLPWLPFSMAPERTVSAILACLPALGMLSLMLRKEDPGILGALIVLLLVMGVSVLLGIMQRGGNASLYIYPITNEGAATGFFANSNHLASLLLVCLPFLAYLGAVLSRSFEKPTERALGWLFVSALASVACLGIVTNGSLAVIVLGPPVAFLSALLLLPTAPRRTSTAIAVCALISVFVVALLVWMSGDDRFGQLASVQTRQDIWTTSVAALKAFFPAGSGFGTFETVYPLFEAPARVDWVFVNHAHNDYLELGVELGALGIFLVAIFLLWWARTTFAIWRGTGGSSIAKAATIASGSLLLHSCVDFPLRTAALSAVFAFCLGLMIRKPASLRSDHRARHLKLDDLAW